MIKKFLIPLVIATSVISGLTAILHSSPAFAGTFLEKDVEEIYEEAEDAKEKEEETKTNDTKSQGKASGSTGGNAAAYTDGTCNYFLGLTSWNCGVTITDQSSLKQGIWSIAMNVLTDITVIAAYLVIGYTIYGGYQYIVSSGDPAKVTSGKKTLVHAFIGLAIVMSANVIMNAIRIALLGSGGSFAADCTSTTCVDPNDMVTGAVQWIIGVAGIIAAIFVVYGGISYIMSNGDPGKIQKAKNAILYASIGLIIVALAEVITAFISNAIREANKTSFINTTTISKEVHETKIH